MILFNVFKYFYTNLVLLLLFLRLKNYHWSSIGYLLHINLVEIYFERNAIRVGRFRKRFKIKISCTFKAVAINSKMEFLCF